ncbi:hypothetical protein HC081234_17340 [Helicobacter cinaedi]|nr:hypothetical protein HC081234_17340 [Helicobacter cinaedi]
MLQLQLLCFVLHFSFLPFQLESKAHTIQKKHFKFWQDLF